MYRYLVLLIGVLIGITAIDLAQATQAELDKDRFVLKSVDGGYLRLDKKTGAISTCRQNQQNWICRSTADDRAVLQNEIDRLQKENERLKDKLADQGERRKTGKPKVNLPDKEELNRVMGFFEDLVKRFLKMAQSVRDQIGEDI